MNGRVGQLEMLGNILPRETPKMHLELFDPAISIGQLAMKFFAYAPRKIVVRHAHCAPSKTLLKHYSVWLVHDLGLLAR